MTVCYLHSNGISVKTTIDSSKMMMYNFVPFDLGR